MNKRLALLMRESQSWNTQFSQFQVFSDKLNSEAHNLRTKLDKEKREAKRLNQVIVQSKQANDDLSAKLQAAEQARTEAATQLAQLDQMEAELEKQVSGVSLGRTTELMPCRASARSSPDSYAKPARRQQRRRPIGDNRPSS